MQTTLGFFRYEVFSVSTHESLYISGVLPKLIWEQGEQQIEESKELQQIRMKQSKFFDKHNETHEEKRMTLKMQHDSFQ